MLEYSFERECRTPYSELYSITIKGTRVGRVDLHFTLTVVHATLCVGENLTADDIQDLMQNGIEGVLPVSPKGRLTTVWGEIKAK